MSTWSRGGLAILLSSLVTSACTSPGGSTAATVTVTETASTTATATATAAPTTVTPSPVTVTETAPTPPAEGGPGGASPALGALGSLPVKGRAPKTGYDRAQFGQAWSDAVEVDGGRNGCDTRNDVLRRDLTGITLDPSTGGCVVLTGTLQDPFTGTTISFVRGRDTSREVQIDHLVALSNAWQTGAQQLGVQQREDLANDPLNLLAVQGSANAQKGAGDAATWLPRKAFRCDYAARQIAVKQRHHLWVTPPERDALTRILRSCPDQPLPTPAGTGVPARGAP
ncbi:GmrSD restriction endonuclease domain-containing protein [Janibacter cremeus]|uniref:GmrSD restriction endonucleases C-terminal domain-containing protein n=1 Tax=Janibacter cremeus TaxID=1285192 RepID=A0A852VMW1_9MICO|nr:hypothetical protein [Janibacter cremeus]